MACHLSSPGEGFRAEYLILSWFTVWIQFVDFLALQRRLCKGGDAREIVLNAWLQDPVAEMPFFPCLGRNPRKRCLEAGFLRVL